MMNSLGIIGGIGPASTIAYYRAILTSYREQPGRLGAPSIIINSIDVDKLLNLVTTNELAALTAYLVEEIERLPRLAPPSASWPRTTPHIVFEDVRQQSAIPLVSIVDAIAEAASPLGLTRLGILGTRFTMSARFYPDVFRGRGIEIIAPTPDEQAYIHEKYTTELLRNVFLPETRQRQRHVDERTRIGVCAPDEGRPHAQQGPESLYQQPPCVGQGKAGHLHQGGPTLGPGEPGRSTSLHLRRKSRSEKLPPDYDPLRGVASTGGRVAGWPGRRASAVTSNLFQCAARLRLSRSKSPFAHAVKSDSSVECAPEGNNDPAADWQATGDVAPRIAAASDSRARGPAL